MCGFVGVIRHDGGGVGPRWLAEATKLLKHRGPDDEGYLTAESGGGPLSSWSGSDTMQGVRLPPLSGAGSGPFSLALGFRRLAILDPSSAGHQPMVSADGRLAVVFNGEIYNHLELRKELEPRWNFQSRSDTETLLAAYRAWGSEFTFRLEGMWALALWDAERGRLLLSRDRFGIKPLYTAKLVGGWAFASEIRPLLSLKGVSRRADPQRLYDYLRFGLTDEAEQTLFAAVTQVPAAHDREILRDSPNPGYARRRWTPPRGLSCSISSEDAVEEVRNLFRESVRQHLLSDVPVGVTLSGGIDSSAIACTMHQLSTAEQPIHAFAHIADDPVLSEESWIDLASQAAGAIVHKVEPGPEELLAELDDLVRCQELPFSNTSIYAQHRVFRQAKQARVKVTLGGQGADELLAGYRSYLGPRLATLLRGGHWIAAYRLLRAAAALPSPDLPGTLFRAGATLVPKFLEGPARLLAREQLLPPWLDQNWFDMQSVRIDSHRPPRSSERLRDGLRQAVTETSLPMLLRYEDRNSMAHSVESRVPFLHTPLVEFLMALPERELIDAKATSKAVFRRAMRGRVPDAILDRRDKVGFATPEQRWIQHLAPALDELLSGEQAERVAGLRPQVLRTAWHTTREGSGKLSAELWRGINLIAWARCFDVEFDRS